jgi:hypothetical protein
MIRKHETAIWIGIYCANQYRASQQSRIVRHDQFTLSHRSIIMIIIVDSIGLLNVGKPPPSHGRTAVQDRDCDSDTSLTTSRAASGQQGPLARARLGVRADWCVAPAMVTVTRMPGNDAQLWCPMSGRVLEAKARVRYQLDSRLSESPES